jgi:hypothetical protein
VANKISTIIDIDAKKAIGALKDVEAGLDDGESASKRVATQLKAMAQVIESEIASSKGAVEALSNALGPEFVADLNASGGSVQMLVADLKTAGVAYDDVRADADELAAALKQVDAAGKTMGDSVKAGAKQASDGIDKVASSGDQSRSVLANMVGNSTQDMAGLGGVAGTLGMAMGQIGEYATEGGISLKNFTKLLGPMAAITAGTMLAAAAVKAIGAEAKEAKRELELAVEQQKLLADGQFEQAAQSLADEWKGTIDILARYGLGVGDLVDHLTGQRDITDTLRAKQDALSTSTVAAGENARLHATEIAKEKGELDALIENLNEGRTAHDNAAVSIQTNAERVNELTAALKGTDPELAKVRGSAEAAGEAMADYGAAAFGATAEIAGAAQATKDFDDSVSDLLGELSQEEAWLNLQDSMRQYIWDMASGKLSTDEQALATNRLKQEMLEYVGSLDTIPPEKKTEIVALVEQDKLKEAQVLIDDLSKPRNVPITFQITNSGDIIGNIPGAGGRRARGGRVAARSLYMVGENPDGTPNKTTELFIPDSPGTIIPAAQTQQMLAGGSGSAGGGGVVRASSGPPVNVTINTGLDPSAVIRAMRHYVRNNGNGELRTLVGL